MTRASILGDSALEQRVARALLTGVRAVAIVTVEEERALAIAEAIAERVDLPLRTWSVASGVDRSGRERELGALLARLLTGERDDEAIWLLFEAARELRGSAQRRMLRELAQARRGPALLLIESDAAALPDIPELELEGLAPPDRDQLGERVREIADELAPERPRIADALREAGDEVAAAGLGLPLERFERTLAAAVLSDTATPATIIAALVRRRLTSAGASVIEPIDPAPSAPRIGFARLDEWLREHAGAFAADAARTERPRALALIGPPGGCRSAARFAAATLGLAAVRIAEFGPPSPERLAATLTALERAAPVAVLLDASDPPALVDALARWLGRRDRGVLALICASSTEHLAPTWALAGALSQTFACDR